MPASSPTKIYGIVGHPVGHSLSPLLHGAAFRALGLDAVHIPWDIAPERLPAFVEAFRLLNIRGCCVTMPHKEKILPLVDVASTSARAVRAANTLTRVGDLIAADNTDVAGFLAPLERERGLGGARALFLGAGGAARAGLAALAEIGVGRIRIASRSHDGARRLAEEFNAEAVPWSERGDVGADLVVNATPLGMKGGSERETPYPAAFLARGTGLAYDMVYTPLETTFLREARAAGWRAISGLDMFVGQANAQFRAWTGRDLPATAIQAATAALG